MNRMNKFLFFVPLQAAGEFLPPFSAEVCCFEMRHERVGHMLLRITRFCCGHRPPKEQQQRMGNISTNRPDMRVGSAQVEDGYV